MLPRFRIVRGSTTDPTLDDNASYEARALVIGWLGLTLELQIAWRLR